MTLPYSEDAEGALIARLLVEPRQIPTLRLAPEDFYVSQYRQAWSAMLRLTASGKPIDLVTLADEGVDLKDALERVTAGHRAPVEQYADIIRRDALRRKYITELDELSARAAYQDNVQTLIASLQDTTARLAEGVDPPDTLGRIDLAHYRHTPDPPLLGVLAPQGTTILYGDGGDGKGWIAARLAALLAESGVRVAVLDFETQPQEWGYRLDKFGLSGDVLYFSPPTTFDLWATEHTARLMRDEGVGYLLIDSAMYASNVEDPYSPNGALAYGRARRRLNNLPALLLAHVTGGMDKVFGSVFWRNESRIVWRLNKDALRHRFMECRKANGYPALEGHRLEIEFDEPAGVLNLHPHGTPWGQGIE